MDEFEAHAQIWAAAERVIRAAESIEEPPGSGCNHYIIGRR